ncbi:MAG: hypothetical protein ABIO70_27580 [Pseudomonadota bacterium]
MTSHLSPLALALLAAIPTSAFADRRERELDHIGQYNFTVELDGLTLASFSAVEETDDGLLALVDGILISDELLWVWLDLLEGDKPLELALVERDTKGRVIQQEALAWVPLVVVVETEDGAVKLGDAEDIEQAAAALHLDGEHGILIPIIWIGDCCDEEEE